MVSAAADRLLLFPSVAQRSFSVASQTINITSRRRRRRQCNAPVAAERMHAVCVARRRCQYAFTNVGGRRCGNEARQQSAERHRRSTTFEMPTARAGAQSHRTDAAAIAQNVRLTVAEVLPHVQRLPQQSADQPAEIRSCFIDYRRQSERPTHATAWKFYPPESPTPHSWLRKQAARTQHGRKPLV